MKTADIQQDDSDAPQDWLGGLSKNQLRQMADKLEEICVLSFGGNPSGVATMWSHLCARMCLDWQEDCGKGEEMLSVLKDAMTKEYRAQADRLALMKQNATSTSTTQ